MAKNRKCWSWSAGEWGYRVRVHEDHPGSNLFITLPDSSNPCGFTTKSLRHKDREAAKKQAKKESAEWVLKGKQARSSTPTLKGLLDLYLAQRTPAKVESEQAADRRRAAMWLKVFSPEKDVRTISLHQWNEFIRDRKSGAVDADGDQIAPEKRRPVRDATVAGDLIYLNTILNHAVNSKIEGTDQYYLDRNPTHGRGTEGYPVPKERNPRRPVVSHDRYLKLIEVTDQVKWSGFFAESSGESRSYLTEVLQLVHATGRRISAVLSLRFEDLRLDEGDFGKILWPAQTDKMTTEHLAPLDAEGRQAIDRILAERHPIGAAFLFPDPRDGAKPVSRYVADRWLEEAEKLAGVPKQKGSLWHAYRRKWASERKHLPDVDVAQAGGWNDLESLKTAYQQPDAETMQRVVSEPRRRREAK